MIKFLGLLLGATLLVASLARAADQPAISSCDLDMIRLPETFIPQHYDVSITPDLKAFTFSGSVMIRVTHSGQPSKCSRSQRIGKLLGKAAKNIFVCGASDGDEELCDKRIILNVGKTIQPTSIKVASLKDYRKNLATEKICLDRTNQLLMINLPRKAKGGEEFEISIDYNGVIGEESRGFFKSPHVNPADSSQYINANTHFFPADARSAFPSFDEPDFKAIFKLTIKHDPELQVISNTAVSDTTFGFDSNNLKQVVTRFKQTNFMSTYNFAFAVGRYDKITCEKRPNVQAYVPLGRVEDSQFIVDTVCKAIDVGEDYFTRPFPLEKLDVVVTRQMRDPSRENWGMLVITEDFLFVNDDTTNVLRAEITKLAVHIVLHQWWGDLMTTKWWDDQWIFDGFTIWQSHWSTAKLYPELDYDFNYLLRLQSVMLDAHASSTVHAIKTYQVLDADQELALFDANTFNKAGAIYQMMDSAFGKNFRMGLIRLLQARAFKTADAKDFFNIVGPMINYNLEPMLRSWLDQRGFPVVQAKLGAGVIELSQSRLVDQPTAESNQQKWVIPIKYQLANQETSANEQLFMSEQRTTIPLPSWFDQTKPEHWVKLNSNFDAFYRVQYDENLLRRLKSPIETQTLSPADRFNVIDDLRALLKLGRVETSLVEEVLTWYYKETNGGVISGLALVAPVLNAAHKAKGRDASETRKIIFDLFEHVFLESKFEVIEGQRHAKLNGRQDALLTLVVYDHKPTIEEALKVFDSSDVHLTPFLRKPVYLAAINYGTDEQFEQFKKRINETKSLYEKQVLIASLVQSLSMAKELNANRAAAMTELLKSVS